MEQSSHYLTVDAEIRVPSATVQVVRTRPSNGIDHIGHQQDAYWIDLSLTPRPANSYVCYRDRWHENRFERLGQVFLIPPGHTIQARSEGGLPHASVICSLQPDRLCEWFDGGLEWTDQRLAATLDIPDTHIRRVLLRLAHELQHPGIASQALTELLTAQLAIELGRFYANVKEPQEKGGLSAQRLRLIDERLKDLQHPPTLAELAQLCEMSVRQLARSFRVSRGCSIGEYMATWRMEHAKHMLLDHQSVKAIAYTLGYASPSSFCYAFRNATGQTPSQYRRQQRPRA